MHISIAVECIKNGFRVKRYGWAYGRYIKMSRSERFVEDESGNYWCPSQDEVLACDWMIC